jgi:hypothetical protein
MTELEITEAKMEKMKNWLKEKGRDLYTNENYIKLHSKLWDLEHGKGTKLPKFKAKYNPKIGKPYKQGGFHNHKKYKAVRRPFKEYIDSFGKPYKVFQ